MSDTGAIRPLTGVRVLDLGRHLAGPTAAMWLGDLGADVIKVERPGTGDDGRLSGPPFFDGQSAFFLSANRNKRSLTLNLKEAAGQEVFRKLAGTSDVVIENFRPGVMEALNIGYERISTENPRVIYCSISGFGADGPDAGKPGLDQIVQGVSGLMSITGFEGEDPVRVGVPIADLLTGLFGAYGVLAALQARERTGKGQRVETSLLESMVGMLAFQGVRYLNGAGAPPPAGNHHPINAPYGVFRARDGFITIGGSGEKRWQLLCDLIDGDDLRNDPRFADNGGRYENRLELADLISEKLQGRDVEEWVEILTSGGVPAGPIYDVAEALDSAQVRHREMVVERPHPVMGMVRLLGLPVKLSDTPGGVDAVPPLLGAHNAEILEELGYSAEERQRFERDGVVG